MVDNLVEQLIEHEGERLKPYRCTAGKLSVGVGRNLDDKGITIAESRIMLSNDITECRSDLQHMFEAQWNWFSDNRKIALIDMRFCLGPSRFRSFRKMIGAIRKEDWETAGKEALDSLWARQVQKSRSALIYTQLVGG